MPSVQPLPREVLERMSTSFNTMEVVRLRERVDLDVQGATYATWHPREVLTGYSWDALAAGCLLRPDGPPRNVLILGFGGGTVARQLRALAPGVRIVGVEIDAGVIDLGRRHLHVDEHEPELHIRDAYEFLADGTERYDAIIDDLFLTGPDDVMRTRVPDGGTLALLQRRLAERGVIVANLITDSGSHRTVRAATRAAFAQAFSSVKVVTPPRGLNEVLVGGVATSSRTDVIAAGAHLREASDRALLQQLKVRALPRSDVAAG